MKRRRLDTLALRALMKATHLLGLALAERLRQYRECGDPVLSRFSSLEESALHVALLREGLSVLGSRWNKIPERQRPHYTPEARFRIVRLKALLALPAEETAQVFRVSVGTVLRWEKEARGEPERETIGTLLRPVPPVRRYADVVRQLVQTLRLAGFSGDRLVAQTLARAGWTLSRRTVQRVRQEKLLTPPPHDCHAAGRCVRARYPNHVWMLDITEIPGLLRLFTFKLAVVFDVFSRCPLAAGVFLQEPTGDDVARLLRGAARRFGRPSHSVSDRGVQFTSERFRKATGRLGIRHRYGALGHAGSIALIERFFRSLKTLARFQERPPLLQGDLERRLASTLEYYLWRRPHQGLGGAVPGEEFLGLTPVHLEAVPPPRGRPGERVGDAPALEVRYLDPEARLPYLVRGAA